MWVVANFITFLAVKEFWRWWSTYSKLNLVRFHDTVIDDRYYQQRCYDFSSEKVYTINKLTTFEECWIEYEDGLKEFSLWLLEDRRIRADLKYSRLPTQENIPGSQKKENEHRSEISLVFWTCYQLDLVITRNSTFRWIKRQLSEFSYLIFLQVLNLLWTVKQATFVAGCVCAHCTDVCQIATQIC